MCWAAPPGWPGRRNSQQSESSFQPLEPRKWGIWLVFTAASLHPSNSLIVLLCVIACVAIFHTSLALTFLLPGSLLCHSPSLLPSDGVSFPSQPSLIQQMYIKPLAVAKHSITLSLFVILQSPSSSVSKASLLIFNIFCVHRKEYISYHQTFQTYQKKKKAIMSSIRDLCNYCPP